MTSTRSIAGGALAALVIALAIAVGAVILSAGQTPTAEAVPAAAAPAAAVAGAPTGDIVAAHRCGKVLVQKSPRLVVKDMRATGTSCKTAKTLIRRVHKSEEPIGRKVNPRTLLTCVVANGNNRIKCTKGRIKVTFKPDCTDSACNI